ncbi:MAG TPA: hypothetical protein VFU76_06460 [Terriglobales bacterium]|nr:hypothetical protein [Terriglobales bacterium]
MNMGGAWVARLIAIVFIVAAFLARRMTGSQTAFWVCIILGAACVLFAAVRSMMPAKRTTDLPPPKTGKFQ